MLGEASRDSTQSDDPLVEEVYSLADWVLGLASCNSVLGPHFKDTGEYPSPSGSFPAVKRSTIRQHEEMALGVLIEHERGHRYRYRS